VSVTPHPGPGARPTPGPSDGAGTLTTRPFTGAGAAAEPLRTEILDLVAHCFAGPPWSEGPDDVVALADRIPGWRDRAGFTGLQVRDERGTLVAAAYGWFGPPEVDGTPMPGVDRDRAFHVVDLMVHAVARRRGLGRVLLDRLVGDRRPAVLVTHPDSGARGLYEAAGWRATGTFTVFGDRERIVYVLTG
jgi:GNAT superfamily N-acetyltransferase